jgi:hypothetical protein
MIVVAASGSVGEDRSKRERRRPRQATDERVRGARDRAHGEQYQPDRAERQPSHVSAQIAEVREDRGAVEQRRQQDHQHDLGIESDLRRARDEPESRAAHDEHDRIRHGQHAGESAEPGHRDEQPGDKKLRFSHSPGGSTREGGGW